MIKLNKEFTPEYGAYIYGLAIILLIIGQLIASIILGAVAPILAKTSRIIVVDGVEIYESEHVLRYAVSFIFQITNLVAFFALVLKSRAKPDLFLTPAKSLPCTDTVNNATVKTGITLTKQKGLGKKTLPIACFVGVLLGIISLFCFMPIAEAAQKLLERIGYDVTPKYVQGFPAQDVLLIILSVIAAPICEELVYRSGLLSGLKKQNFINRQKGNYGINTNTISNNDSTITAEYNKILSKGTLSSRIKISALCGIAFAFMHLSPEQTVYQFFLGFGASMLTLSVGSVIPAMLMHAASNFFVALSMIGNPIMAGAFDWYESVFIDKSVAVFAIGSVAFTVIGLALMVAIPTLFTMLGRVKPKTNQACLNAGSYNKNINLNSNKNKSTIVKGNQNKIKGLRGDNTKGDSYHNNNDLSGRRKGFFAKHFFMAIYLIVLALCLVAWIMVFADKM